MDATFQTIAKLEAAERQLAQAIRLFFDRGDQIAIHTLAAAAYQILSDICEQRGFTREIEDSTVLEEMGVKRQVLAAMRTPQNFFKHADRDASATVRFSPMLSVCFMLYAVSFHYAITEKQFSEGIVFRSWFYAKHPDRAPEPMRAVLTAMAPILDPSDLQFFSSQIPIVARRLYP